MPQTKYTNVFVHGLFGWGEEDAIYRYFPQWGMASGSVLKYLRGLGYRCCAPSLGPLSSAWDRACELYAQLTGTRVDYGAAHAARHDHARFGRVYTTPLAPDWSEDHKINLIGHSFGGATSRLLLELLANGSAEEMAACDDPSPLFAGGKAGWVHSITCVASPHNGSTLGSAAPDAVRMVAEMNALLAKNAARFSENKTFDYKLDQFGVQPVPGEDFVETVARFTEVTIRHRDGAFFDLGVDGAIALNGAIAMQPNVYYFSEPCCRTVMRRQDVSHRPDTTMPALLRESAKLMGAYYDHVTPGGVEIDRTWCANDGMVNTVSALCPLGAPHAEVTDETETFQPGIWNVMPVRSADHLEIVGGIGHPLRTRKFYKQLMARIDRT